MKLMRCAMFALMASVLLFSCKKDDSLTPEEEKKDIYIGGYSNSNPSAVYFNNGTLFSVPNCPGISSMAVQGDDVYVPNNLGYVKNGIQVNLPEVVSTRAIGILNNDVYVVGATTDNFSVYWKNGVLHKLPTLNGIQSYDVTAIAITFSGNDVYILGSNNNSDQGVLFWKNDVMQIVGKGQATGIAVSGNDVYITGLTINEFGVYWKNGVLKKPLLPNANGAGPIGISVLTSVYINGSDVYMTGMVTSGPFYWKNDQPVALPGSYNAWTSDIVVKGKDVFVAGNEGEFYPSGTGAFSTSYGCIWKNGVKDTVIKDGQANCIVLKN